MKYYSRLKLYKSGKGTGTNVYNPETEEAYSYKWFCYAKKIKDVWVVTSNSYSNTTAKHISQFLRLKGYPNVKYIAAPGGLKNKPAIIEGYEYTIRKLLNAINTKGTRKEKNIQRAEQIKQIREDIKFVEKYL